MNKLVKNPLNIIFAIVFLALLALSGYGLVKEGVSISSVVGLIAVLTGIAAMVFSLVNQASCRSSLLKVVQGLAGGEFNELEDHQLGSLSREVDRILKKAADDKARNAELAAQFRDLASQLSNIARNAVNDSQSARAMLKDLHSQVNQLSSALNSVKEATNKQQEIASRTESTGNSGKTVMSKAIGSVTSMTDTVMDTVSEIQELGEKSNNVHGILATITNITEQTNLLALNAAIEAARAGEHGRGFAVVADEVRGLASKAQHSASEIGQIIEGLVVQVNEAVKRTDGSRKLVEVMDQEINEAAESYSNVMAGITEISQYADNVNAQASAQGTAAEKIFAEIKHLEQSFDRATHDAGLLDSLGQQLEELSDQFVNGSSSGSTPAPMPMLERPAPKPAARPAPAPAPTPAPKPAAPAPEKKPEPPPAAAKPTPAPAPADDDDDDIELF